MRAPYLGLQTFDEDSADLFFGRNAVSLGLRRGEVVGLLWEDVDLAAATLRIIGSVQWLDGKLVRSTPKTAMSVRMLPLPAPLVEALRKHRKWLEEEHRACANWEEHGYMFPSDRGTPLNPYNLLRHFKQTLAKAKLPANTRFHDLRHSCATLLVAEGVHPRVIMEILCHSSITVTMNTYSHVPPEQQRAATAKLDTLLRF